MALRRQPLRKTSIVNQFISFLPHLPYLSLFTSLPANLYEGSSSLTICECVSVACTPLIAIFERLIFTFKGCFECRPPRLQNCGNRFEEIARLASETIFTVNEVEALYELFKKLSSSIIDDGLIQKEELHLALFKTPSDENLFLNRVKAMVIVILMESDITLSDDLLEAIMDRTFADADADKDDRINTEEWKDFVLRNPNLLKNMTLPYLKDLSLATVFPSFTFNTRIED
ncbi:calcineurin B-like protein 10 isoform X6 [Quercus robur]|uniref:calcineurin B-like protein 10 isoform X6 n=1 Tax=Quercus robur TaxID=38942 RepID=UPI002162AB23|nr:calcineurin B-like protein 10 isoform X6 [Quercus robur]